ncbi:MAG TPA: alpha/beta hydrolase-fold protein [Polyangia bacterium]|nr:alpha/beta hydrolase-fold protein [Polyangia bacterium]
MSHQNPRLLLASLLLVGCAAAPTLAPGTDGGAPADSGGHDHDSDGAPPASDGGAGGGDLAPTGVTTIRIHYPVGSHALALRGDTAPLDWSHGVALTSTDGKTFIYTFPDLQAPAQFKPLLDDTAWSHGPNYTVTRGATVDVYPHFNATAGRVVNLFPNFHSTLLNNNRNVWAYLPPSYDENPLATFPVLYMHDGQNLFDPALAFGGNEWKVDETLDGAAEGDGSIRELIVIGPENTSQRIYEYTPTTDPSTPGGGGGDLYLRMLVEELKPQVDAMLRTQPGRDTTGVMGSSLGGLISAYAGVTHPDVFGIVGAMSPSTWWNNDWIVGDVNKMPAAPMRPERVYVDSGDSQQADDANDTAQLAAAYLGLGYVEGQSFHRVVQTGAQHNEVYWAQRLPGALGFLFGPRTP